MALSVFYIQIIYDRVRQTKLCWGEVNLPQNQEFPTKGDNILWRNKQNRSMQLSIWLVTSVVAYERIVQEDSTEWRSFGRRANIN